jgi:hypothetical protein
MSGCTPTEIVCECYCHKVNKLLSEKCSCCKTDAKNFYVDVHMLHTMRQTIEAWQKGCEVLISDMQQRIHELEKEKIDYSALCEGKPFKCPVCDGEGKNKNKLVMEGVKEPSTITMKNPECLSCGGRGIVWG